MKDTSDEILQIQREIFYKKTSSERFLIGSELVNFGRIIVESNIKQSNPDISELDLRLEVFKRCYESYFSKDELENIFKSMTAYYLKNQSK